MDLTKTSSTDLETKVMEQNEELAVLQQSKDQLQLEVETWNDKYVKYLMRKVDEKTNLTTKHKDVRKKEKYQHECNKKCKYFYRVTELKEQLKDTEQEKEELNEKIAFKDNELLVSCVHSLDVKF